jgi:adenine-specific DNA-methyltransferase
LIKEIFEEVVFTYSKPTELINYLLKISTPKNSVILDFFAGSGTTGHAVLELNKEDGGNRQFILVTNNGDEKSEHKIAEKITYERLKRVMNGYQNKKGEQIEGLGGNLDYLRCDFIDKISHEDNMRLNIAKNSKDTILFKEGASGIEKEEKVKNESIYTIVTNLHSSTTAIYQSLDDSYLDKFKKDLEKISGYKSLYLNPLIGSEDYFRDLKDITIQEMPNIN